MAKDRDENFMERLMKQVIKGLIYLLIFVVVFALIILPIVNKHIPGLLGNVEESDVQVIEDAMNVTYSDVAGYACIIEGKAENKGDKSCTKATIEFSLYNEANELVGTAMAVVENIEAGASAEFTAGNVSYMEEKPHSYKLKRIIMT